MKTIKAWAIVSSSGNLESNGDGYYTVFMNRDTAKSESIPSRRERIVPVEIREVPTAKKRGAK